MNIIQSISILCFLWLFRNIPPHLYLLFELQVISLTIKMFHLHNSGIEDLLDSKKSSTYYER